MSPAPASRTESFSSSAKAEQTHIERAGAPMELISEFDESVVIAEGEEKINAYTWYLLGVGALSGFLFGYDTGVISCILVNIKTDIGGTLLSEGQKELITSATSVGAFFGAWFGGYAMDTIGRKGVLMAGDVFFTVGALLAATAFSYAQLVIGAVTDCIGAGMTFHKAWRYLFAISILPALFQIVAMHFLPESPRYSLMKGNRDQARKTLQLVYAKATPEVIERKLDIIAATVQIGQAFKEKYPTVLKRLRAILSNGLYRRPVLISSTLFIGCQLGGVNSLMYYSGTIFAAAGLKNSNAVTIAVAATNVTSTTVGTLFLDRYGRRRTWLTGAPIAMLALVFGSMCFHFMTESTSGKLDTSGASTVHYPQNWTVGMIMCMIIYLIGFCPSLGTVPYTTIELLPLEIRGTGAAISVGAQWIGNIMLSSSFLSVMNKTGPAGSFGIYAVVILLTIIFVYFCYPEPSGLSIEETAELFLEGFGVKKAAAMRKARQNVVKANHQHEKEAEIEA
ncbi:MFS transporter, SP family, arabinose:H+ symporter [Pseudohyphozyma bogoriensis]|nr:MFS transporter, SP family, arabinose:H+ symporter [Pseudohyphozyma bogoriensis]